MNHKDFSKSNKSFPIELLRILACCMVITIHTHLPVKTEDGGYDSSLVLLSCLIGDAVGIFWLIAGCFRFDKELDYKKTRKTTFKKIVIPMIIVSALVFYIGGFLEGKTFSESVSRTGADYISVLKHLIQWKNPVSGLGHFWYLYVYLLIILAIPVLHAFVGYLDDHPNAEKVFCIITMLLFCLNDLTLNKTFAFSHHAINGAIPGAIEIIWGHILYKNRKKLNFRYSSLVWMLLFTVLMIVRWRVQLWLYSSADTNHMLSWYTSIGLCCAACLFLTFLKLFENTADQRVKGIVAYIGSKTFYIYLIHMIIYSLFKLYGVKDIVYNLTAEKCTGFVGEILYTVLMTSAVFICSFIVSALADGLKDIGHSLIKRQNSTEQESM